MDKSLHIGVRRGEEVIDYVSGFLRLARSMNARGDTYVP